MKSGFLIFTLVCAGSAAQAQWTPPAGIPRPTFGIAEARPAYAAGAATHYWVDGLVACNDGNNGGRGSPAAPRCTIPALLSAGSVVYVASHARNAAVKANGTPLSPVWIVGTGSALFQPKSVGVYLSIHGSSHVIVDGLNFDGTGTPNTQGSMAWAISASDHVAVRNSTIRNLPAPPYNPMRFTSGGAGSWYSSLTSLVATNGNLTDIVLYKNDISNNAGGQDLDYENGRHAILAAGDPRGVYRVERVWIVDNTIHNNPEDAIQLGQSAAAADQTLCRYFYIGRNTLTNNGENAIDLKATDHIVISENTMSGYKPTAYRAGAVSGSDGSAAVINDDGKGPLQSWWINNFIHSSRVGIRNQAAGGVHALVGNVFMNIKKTALEVEPATTGSAAGVGYWQSAGAASVYLGNNTFFDVNGGIYLHNAATALVLNNLVSHLADHTRGWPVNINNAASIQVGSNLYYDPQGAVRRDTNALSLTDLVGLDPLFVNAAAYDIRLSPVSPALDRANNAYAEAIANHYVTLYGAGIRTDILGKPRPNGTSWDIGALEH